MPKNAFACKRCNASFHSADSLRRHLIVQHAKKLRIDAAGHIEEYEINDYERERQKIRHRQMKSPYPKKACHAGEDSALRHAHSKSPPYSQSIPSLLSLKRHTPECPVIKNATLDHEACAIASENNTRPAAHFSPLININTSSVLSHLLAQCLDYQR
jgi:hypothetical protein